MANDKTISSGVISPLGSQAGVYVKFVDSITDIDSAVTSLLTDNTEGGLYNTLTKVNEYIQDTSKDITSLSEREKQIVRQLRSAGDDVKRSISEIQKQATELKKNTNLAAGAENQFISQLAKGINVLDKTLSDPHIGRLMVTRAGGTGKGRLREQYKQYAQELAIAQKISQQEYAQLLSDIENATILDSDVDENFGIPKLNKVVSSAVKKTSTNSGKSSPVSGAAQRVANVSKTKFKEAAHKTTVQKTTTGGYDKWLKKLPKNVQDMITGKYIAQRTKHGNAGDRALTKELESGAQSFGKKLQSISDKMVKNGFEVSYRYNPQDNTVDLSYYRSADLEAGLVDINNIPKFTFHLEKNNTIGTGSNKKVNTFVDYLGENGIGRYTVMEAEIAAVDEALDREIKGKKLREASYEDINYVAKRAAGSVTKVSPGSSQSVINEFNKDTKASQSPQHDAMKALSTNLRPLFQQIKLKYKKLYALEKGGGASGRPVNVDGILAEAYTEILSAPANAVDSIVAGLVGRYPEIFGDANGREILKMIREVRNQGAQLWGGGVSEESLRTGKVASSSARNIVPGDVFMAQATRQQGVNHLKRATSNAYVASSLTSAQGRDMGLKYGTVDSFTASTGTIEVPDYIIHEVWEEMGLPGLAPSVREGGMLIDETLLGDLDTSTRKFFASISKEEYQKLWDKKARGLRKKQYANLSDSEWENLLKNNDAVRASIQQAIFKNVLRKKGKNVRNFSFTGADFNADTNEWEFEGAERIKVGTGTRVTDSYGNTRSATTRVSNEFVKRVAERVGIAKDVIPYVHAIAEQTSTTPDIRKFGAAISGTLNGVLILAKQKGWDYKTLVTFLRAQGKGGEFIADILKYSDAEGLYEIDSDKVRELEANTPEEEMNQTRWEALYALNEAAVKMGAMSKNPLEKKDGQMHATGAAGLTFRNIGVHDAYDYGNEDDSVSMQAGYESLRRELGGQVAAGKISKKDAQDLAEMYKSRFLPSEKELAELERKQKDEEQARELTNRSADKNFTPDTSTSFSMGFGKDFSINLEEIEEEVRDSSGRIVNYERTLRGRIDAKKKEMIKEAADRGIKLAAEEIRPYIEGVGLAGLMEYRDDQGNVTSQHHVQGSKLFLPGYYGKGTGDYFTKDLYSVINAVREGDVEKIADRGLTAYARMMSDTRFKEGTEYKNTWKQKTPDSRMWKTTGANPYDILTDEEFAKASLAEQHKSTLASSGLLLNRADTRRVLHNTTNEELASLYKELYGEEWTQGTSKKAKNDLVEYILDSLTVGSQAYNQMLERKGSLDNVHGLKAIIGRLPYLQGIDLHQLSDIFVANSSMNLDSGSVMLGTGLAADINADFDGDRITLALMAASAGLTPKQAETFIEVGMNMRKAYRTKALAMREKDEQKKEENLYEKKVFDPESDIYSGIAAKINKQFTGTFSNLSTVMRNYLTAEGRDETRFMRDDVDPNVYEDQRIAASGAIARSLFASLEQDSISSKKVIDRIMRMRLGGDWQSKSAEERNAALNATLTDFQDISNSFMAGKVSFTDLLAKLQATGILGDDDDIITSQRSLDQIFELIGGFTNKDLVLENLFGSKEAGAAAFSERKISKAALERAFMLATDSTDVAGIDRRLNALRSKKQYANYLLNYENNPAYYGGVKGPLQTENLPTAAYEALQVAIERSGEALKKEMALEREKIGIATKEGAAIRRSAAAYGELAEKIDDLNPLHSPSEIAKLITQEAFGKNTFETETAGLYEQMGSARALLQSGEWQKMTPSQRMAHFGYGEDQLEHFNSVSTYATSSGMGKMAHAVSEALIRARNFGFDAKTVKELRGLGAANPDNANLATIITELDEVLKKYSEEAQILSSSPELADYRNRDAIYRGEQNFARANMFIRGKDDKYLTPEQRIATNAFGGFLSGQMDAAILRNTKDDFGREHRVFNILDYKNKSGPIKDADIVQMVEYIQMLKQVQSELKSGKYTVDQYVEEYNKRNNANSSNNRALSKDWAQALLEADDIVASIIQTDDTGRTTASNIGAVPNDIITKIMARAALSDEEKKALRAAVSRDVSPLHVLGEADWHKQLREGLGIGVEKDKETVKASHMQQVVAANGEVIKRRSSTQYGESEDLSEINKLLTQRLSIEKQIFELTQKRKYLEDKIKSGDAGAVVAYDSLGIQLEEAQGEWNSVEGEINQRYNNLTKEAQTKFENNEMLRTDINERRNRIAGSSMQEGARNQAAQDYERSMRERLAIESKLDQMIQRRNTTYSRLEINALDNAIDAQNQKLALVKAEGEQIAKNTNLRDADRKRIEAEYATERAVQKAQNATNMHGSRNIWDMMGYDIKRSFAMIFDFGLAHRGIAAIQMKFRELIQTVQELDKAMTNIRIVTGMNNSEAQDLMKTYNGLAKELGVTTQAIAEASNEWLRQGYTAEETNDLIQGSVYLSTLGMIDASQATEYLTSMLKGFRLEANQVNDAVSMLVKLDMEYAASAGDIAEGLSRTATTAQMAGLSLEEAASAITIIKDVSQKSASSIGESMKTLLSRYGNVKAGNFSTMMDTGETDESLNDTEKVLNAIGISIRSSSMEFRDFSDVLDDLADKWVSLSSVEKNAVATAMAGVRQRENFNILLENYDSYKEAVESASDSEGTAEEKFEAYSDSIEAALNRLKDAWDGIVQRIEGNEIFKGFINAITFLTEQIPRLIQMFVSLFATMNAYKIPIWMKQLGGAIDPRRSLGFGRFAGLGVDKPWTASGQKQRAAIRNYEYYQSTGQTDKMKEIESQLPEGYRDKFVNKEFESGDAEKMVNEQQEANQHLETIERAVTGKPVPGAPATSAAGGVPTEQVAEVAEAATEAVSGAGVEAEGVAAVTEEVTNTLTQEGIDPNEYAKKRDEFNNALHEEQSLKGQLGGLRTSRNNKAAQARYLDYSGDIEGANKLRAEVVQMDRQDLELQQQINAAVEKRKTAHTELNSLQAQGNSLSQTEAVTEERIVNAQERQEGAAARENGNEIQGVVNANNEAAAEERIALAQERQALAAQQEAAAEASMLGGRPSSGAIPLGAMSQNSLNQITGTVSAPQTNPRQNLLLQTGANAPGRAVLKLKVGQREQFGMPTQQQVANIASQNTQTGIVSAAGGAIKRGAGKAWGFAKNTLGAGNIMGSAMGGVGSAITGAMNTEGSVGDKLLSGAIQGGLTAGLTAIGGPIGGMIGNIVGPFISDGVLKLIHADEIARQQRVEEAKKQLEALNEINESIDEGNNLVLKDSEDYDAEDYTQIQELFGEYKSAIITNDDLREEFLDSLEEMGYEIDDNVSEIENSTNALEEFRDSTENASMVMAAFTAAQERQKAIQLEASQEEERYQLQQELEDLDFARVWQSDEALEAINASEIGKAYGGFSSIQEFLGFLQDSGGVLGNMGTLGLEGIEQYEKKLAEYEALDAAVQEHYLNAAFAESGVSSMSNVDIKGSSLQGVIRRIAREWAEDNPGMLLEDGTFTEDSLQQIEALLRQDERYSSLFNSGNLTYAEVYDKGNKNERDRITEALGLDSFEEAMELAGKGGAEDIALLEKAADSLGYTMDELVDKIYNLDDAKILQFAQALGFTTDFVEANIGALGGLDMETVLGGMEALNERYDELADVFADLADDMALTNENMKTIMEKYPQLLRGGDGSISKNNILGNLVDIFMGGANSESGLAYASQMVQEAYESTSFWDLFKESNIGENNDWAGIFEGLTDDELELLRSDAVTKFNDLSTDIKNKLTTEGWESVKDLISETTGVTEAQDVLEEAITGWQKQVWETEISNLESIKESLDDVNEARQKELDLIKAKDALENARKEKKLVYRAGAGWVYESDQEAIQEAQQEVEDLEAQTSQEDLQYQIDQYQKLIDMLDNQEEEEELRAQRQIFEQFAENLNKQLGDGKDGSYLHSILQFFNRDFQAKVQDAINGTVVGQAFAAEKQNQEEAVKTLDSAYDELAKAKQAYEAEENGTFEKNEKAKIYNQKLKEYQTAVNVAKNAGVSSENLSDRASSAGLTEEETKTLLSNWTSGLATSKKVDENSIVYLSAGLTADKNDETTFAGLRSNTDLKNSSDAYWWINGAFLQEDTYKLLEGDWNKQFGKQKYNWVLMYNPETKSYRGSEWQKISDYNKEIDTFDEAKKKLPAYTLIFNPDYKDYAAFVGNNKEIYWVGTENNLSNKGHQSSQGLISDKNNERLNRWASGTTSASGGLSLVNELGTEGIITPQGTLTSLPSRTGVVPADITKNLWALGEVAPNLVKNLDSITSKLPEGSLGSSDDHSTNIHNLYATFQADENFDFDEFLVDVRGVIGTTRHSAG